MGEQNYEEMTVEELRDEIRDREIAGTSSMTKDELVKTLQDDDAGKLPTEDEDGNVTEADDDSGKDIDRADRDEVAVEHMTSTTSDGREVEVEVGMNGEDPVSPENPPAKAVLREGEQEVDVSESQTKEGEEGTTAVGAN